MKDKVRPLLEAAAKEYVSQGHRLAEAHRGLRQVVVSFACTLRLAHERRCATVSRHAGRVAGRGAQRGECSLTRLACAIATSPRRRGEVKSRNVRRRNRPTRRADAILAVNNIEVVYDHVILVLKGVSLDVPQGRHRRAARRQRRRQDHDAEGDLQSAARRARRSHQGLDPVRRRGGAGAVAERTGPARLHPGDGRPPLLRAISRSRKICSPARSRAATAAPRSRATSSSSTAISRACASGARRSPATPPAASSRCARSAAR